MKRDFLTLSDFSSEEILEIVELSLKLKKERYEGKLRTDMSGKTAVLIFDKPSLRTKITFETAIYELGGNALNMSSANGKLGERESVSDIAKNLERWVHLLIVRTFDDNAVIKLAQSAKIPVINALTDKFHPCQSIALGVTLRERFGNKKIKFAYIGDGNNVCASHLNFCTKVGYDFTAITPSGYEPDARTVKECRKTAEKTNSNITLTNDVDYGLTDADVVYTDVWASMGHESEAQKRKEIFGKYRVDESLMKKTKNGALFSHCLPAHRGDEVVDCVLDGECSMAFDEAENRLHAHKAIIVYLLKKSK
ncbi:MAG: ornithine carbamoyltransferase [Chitinispirillales bacterium]|jgi:ornithine carbamoyltransferase|nr:ornithine carbamoyltransferase [Chitinispirillales bacterium]